MKYIDMENWKRKEHFDYFSHLDYPHFNICANVDITRYHRYLKANGLPFFISMVYAASKAANDIYEFRLRIRDGKVVEHDNVSPSFTVMGENEVFGFCTASYTDSYDKFKEKHFQKLTGPKET
jgi:chloramphenicol O-acetyltransferase type A